MRLSFSRPTAALSAVLFLVWQLAQFAHAAPVQPVYGGPIPTRNQRGYNLLFLSFEPEAPDVLPAGQRDLALQLDIANNFLIPAVPSGASAVQEDNETQRLTFSLHWGLGHGTEAALFVPVMWRDGGFMDPVINLWHHLWGMSQSYDSTLSRTQVGDFHSVLLDRRPDGTDIVNVGNAFGLCDISATMKQCLIENPSFAAALRLGLKLPTGNPDELLGSGGTDVGADVDMRQNLGRDVSLYFNWSHSWLGKDPAIATARTWWEQGIVAIEYRANRKDSYVLQSDWNSLAVVTGNPWADRQQRTATFGYRRTVNDRLRYNVSFTENGDVFNHSTPWLFEIGPDFTVSFSMSWLR